MQDACLLLALLLAEYVHLLGLVSPASLLIVVVRDATPLIGAGMIRLENCLTSPHQQSPELSEKSLEPTERPLGNWKC